MSVAPPRASSRVAPGGRAVRMLDTAAGRMVVQATPRGIARLEQVGPQVGPDEAAEWFDPQRSGGEYADAVDSTVAGDDREPGAAAGHLDRLADQLSAYLSGEGREFAVPVDWEAAGVHDEFAREVYSEIQHIPYGETSTYGQISVDAGRPRSARRVGRLCSLVPVSFVIPVHRVIRADGGMGNCPGYRLRLLDHERRNLTATAPIALR